MNRGYSNSWRVRLFWCVDWAWTMQGCEDGEEWDTARDSGKSMSQLVLYNMDLHPHTKFVSFFCISLYNHYRR